MKAYMCDWLHPIMFFCPFCVLCCVFAFRMNFFCVHSVFSAVCLAFYVFCSVCVLMKVLFVSGELIWAALREIRLKI